LSVTGDSVNGDTRAANPSTYIADGYLNGTISAAGASNFSATLVRPDSLASSFPEGTIGGFSSRGYDTFLSIPFGSAGINDPNGVPTGGVALVGGVVTEFAATEPASFVIIALLGLAQVGMARLRNRRRRGLVA
jgi:hypothetical protein